ncbi:MAG: hypothetical protein ACKO0W_11570 [Planctomycetota bacterium]
MDNLKIGIAVLGLAPALLALSGCASGDAARVPDRAPTRGTLVLAAEESAGFGRNDGALGADRAPVVRESESAAIFVRDRQQVINGRTYGDYDSITRSYERLRR